MDDTGLEPTLEMAATLEAIAKDVRMALETLNASAGRDAEHL